MEFERFIEAVTTAMPAIVYSMDAQGSAYKYLSPAIKRMLGYTPEEIVALGGPNYMLSIMHPEDRERVMRKHFERVELYNKATPEEQDQYTHVDDYRLRHRNGEWRWFRSSGVIFDRAPDGAILTVLGIAQDITETKQLEERLQFSDRMASVGRLAAGLAHEINTPLTHVLVSQDLALEELKRGTSSERIAAHVEAASSSAERISKIVRELKSFSRRQQGPLTDVDVPAAIESSLTMVQNELRRRATIIRELAPVPPVRADEGRLVQVLLNLLLNAAQSMPEGRPVEECEIKVRTGLDPSGQVFIEVVDNGQGIAPESLGSIFDPFFTTKPVGEGTGLGLSICYNIIKSFDGRITAESERGRGTAMRVLIPAAATASTRTGSAPPVVADTRRRGTVLIIEDDEGVAETLADALRGDSHSVTIALTARQALDELRAGTAFDIILCDVTMPMMSGVQIFESLAADADADRRLRERFVFMTGGLLTARDQDSLRRVPNKVISKPFRLHAVRSLVQAAVE